MNEPNHNPGLSFLGFTGGALALVVTLGIVMIVLFCVGCFAFCGVGALMSPDPAVTP